MGISQNKADSKKAPSHQLATEPESSITSLELARQELNRIYGLAAAGELDEPKLNLMLKPLQALITSYDKTAPTKLEHTINVDDTQLSADISQAFNKLEAKLRNLGFQNDHLKKEWKILANKPDEPWLAKDEEHLVSRMERKVYIVVKLQDSSPKKKGS